ncbi:hypothetical protein Pmani_013677 [Petrolisthes manimaculis]|uniref:Uncharacterized protein n=1 Tax=Petrolisthes manimaculis TaxID=1843537 RepID=A0AAE1PVK6_9EUCA|nr:hypothetical protein Pmani_013677 [Petrolisthes manimaculis]
MAAATRFRPASIGLLLPLLLPLLVGSSAAPIQQQGANTDLLHHYNQRVRQPLQPVGRDYDVLGGVGNEDNGITSEIGAEIIIPILLRSQSTHQHPSYPLMAPLTQSLGTVPLSKRSDATLTFNPHDATLTFADHCNK